MKLQPKFLFPYLCVSVIKSLKCVCDKVLHGAVAGVMCPEEHLRVPVPGRALESLLAAAGQDVRGAFPRGGVPSWLSFMLL